MLNSCLKKDFKALTREGKNYILLIAPIVFAIFSILLLVAINAIISNVDTSSLDEDMQLIYNLFEANYSMSLTFFSQFIVTYYTIILIVIVRNSCSREIKKNQWVLPMNAGISPRDLFVSKLISNLIWIIGSIFVASIINMLFTLTFCKPNGFSIGMVFYNYLTNILFIGMITVILICIDYMTKKGFIGAIIVAIICFLLPDILSYIAITSSTTLLNYTPLSWYMYYGMPEFPKTIELVFQYLIWGAVVIILPVLAVLKNKIKNLLIEEINNYSNISVLNS